MHAASGAKASVHDVAAIGNADMIAQLAMNSNRRRRKPNVDRRAARANLLAQATPADTCRNGRCVDVELD
jgi:hypothetical protein